MSNYNLDTKKMKKVREFKIHVNLICLLFLWVFVYFEAKLYTPVEIFEYLFGNESDGTFVWLNLLLYIITVSRFNVVVGHIVDILTIPENVKLVVTSRGLVVKDSNRINYIAEKNDIHSMIINERKDTIELHLMVGKLQGKKRYRLYYVTKDSKNLEYVITQMLQS